MIFFANWDKSIEICDDSELKSKILEILKDDKYFNRLFSNASFLNKEEDNYEWFCQRFRRAFIN